MDMIVELKGGCQCRVTECLHSCNSTFDHGTASKQLKALTLMLWLRVAAYARDHATCVPSHLRFTFNFIHDSDNVYQQLIAGKPRPMTDIFWKCEGRQCSAAS